MCHCVCIVLHRHVIPSFWHVIDALCLRVLSLRTATRNVIFLFNRGESSSVVMLITLLSSSFVFMFFYTAVTFSATSLICFILFILTFILFHRRLSSCVSFQNWETAFTSPISPRNHPLPSKALFRARYSYTPGVRPSVH